MATEMHVSTDVTLRVFDDIREAVVRHFDTERELGVPAFKDMVGVSRKFAIPLLEHFDRKGVTVRSGNVRLKGRGVP